MAAENVVTLTEENFEQEVVKSDMPVLVDFWATWCMPCRQLAPTVDAIAAEYAGKVKVGKLDIDEGQTVASQFGIQGIPTLILFKGGRAVKTMVGVQPKRSIEQAIAEHAG